MKKINKKLLIGSIIILMLILISVCAPYIAKIDPDENAISNRLKPPCTEYIFGTDHLGRDVFSRVVYGSRSSIGISILVLMISLTVGLVLGLLSGYFGGIIDKVIITIVELVLAFPSMILALAVVGILGSGLKNAVIAVSLVSWVGYTRLVRGMVMSIKEKEFVKSAMLNGTSHFKIIIRHILPNVINPVIIYAATNISGIMMQIASLSFLGMGIQPPIAEWGNMLNDARGYITIAPWMTIVPSIALIIMTMGFNLFGEGVAKLLDEKRIGGA